MIDEEHGALVMKGLMGIVRLQERRLAVQLLIWQYQKRKLPLPEYTALERQAGQLVDEAHRIARERGRNVLTILREMIGAQRKD